MVKYLRPETLFNATKFQSYINEITIANSLPITSSDGHCIDLSKIFMPHD